MSNWIVASLMTRLLDLLSAGALQTGGKLHDTCLANTLIEANQTEGDDPDGIATQARNRLGGMGAGVGRDFLRNLFFMCAGFRTFSPISGSRTGKFSNCDVPAPGSLLLLVLALVSLLLPLCGLTTSRLLGKCCNNS